MFSLDDLENRSEYLSSCPISAKDNHGLFEASSLLVSQLRFQSTSPTNPLEPEKCLSVGWDINISWMRSKGVKLLFRNRRTIPFLFVSLVFVPTLFLIPRLISFQFYF